MLLIADTTVISNFVLIGRLDLLEGIKDLMISMPGDLPKEETYLSQEA